MKHQQLHQDNRLSWNAATKAHNSHKADQAGFLRQGGTTLFPEEIALLGDLQGRRLVHLQCNAGQDTISLARLGAEVTGVDISDEAITFASNLARESETPAEFIRADVYDWLASSEPGYDIVFCSYGAVCWLSDLELWARGVASVLIPGGRFVAVDFHPLAMIFDEQWKIRYPYFADGKVLTWDEGVGDYVGRSKGSLSPSGHLEGDNDFSNPYPVHEFQWAIGEVLRSLIAAGLSITAFTEYPYTNGVPLYDDMVERGDRRFFPPAKIPSLPLMWSVVAAKPG